MRSIISWGFAALFNFVGVLAQLSHDPDQGAILGLSVICIILCLSADRIVEAIEGE
jgi:hypothetical protein